MDFANQLTRTPLTLATATDAPSYSLDFTRPVAAPRAPTRSRPRSALSERLEGFARRDFLGSALVVLFLLGVTTYGFVRGGGYAAFIESDGALYDQAAKAIGFPIKAITITGAHELSESEILSLAEVSPRNSLLFLNVGAIRARLKSVPLVKEASVSKLFPNRLLIEIQERRPFALWQKDGAISLIAADGAAIDDLHDARFETLPLVTGVGANEKIADYVALLDAAGDLKPRIRAGIYVAGRRWTLKTEGGIEIDLPEQDAARALSHLALLEHDSHILEKDILSLDLRIPGRVVARLSADASAARQAMLSKKTKKSGAAT